MFNWLRKIFKKSQKPDPFYAQVMEFELEYQRFREWGLSHSQALFQMHQTAMKKREQR